MSNIINKVLSFQKRTDLPSFRVGDLINVYQEIEEAGKKRIQPFEGLVIARKHGNEPGASFTVRKNIAGIGTEKTFPLHSPTIKKIVIVKKAKRITGSKLYWTRNKTDREIRKRLKFEQVFQKKSPKKIEIKKEGEAKKEKTKKP